MLTFYEADFVRFRHLKLLKVACCFRPDTYSSTGLWMVWGIGAYVYDYFHTSAMEERIHTLESVLTVHQFVIMFLSASLIVLISYIIFKKR
ncbi:hypothetical protein SRHO_G00193750 [Serrasalmus rhombeus]